MPVNQKKERVKQHAHTINIRAVQSQVFLRINSSLKYYILQVRNKFS